MTDLVTLRRVVRECIEDYAKQQTRYLELRSTPKEFKKAGGSNETPATKMDYIRAIMHEIELQEEQNPRIKVRYLLSISRAGSLEDAQQAVQLALDARKESPLIVGVELSGDPRVGNFEELKPVFEQAR